MTDDRQRLALYEDVEAALLQGGSDRAMREVAGLLAVHLADRMDKKDRRTSDPAVQETLFRHSIRTFPESPYAARSLGYKLEHEGRALEAMELYRDQLARSDAERLDLRLLLASCCSPYLDDGRQGFTRCAEHNVGIRAWVHVGHAAVRIFYDSPAKKHVVLFSCTQSIRTRYFVVMNPQIFKGVERDSTPRALHQDVRHAAP